ncbi:hypothetical protein [Winogradskya humida]|uniref:Uncharacterized protein n=1 Tax=Winogradskya humida TaxID=113566 RepID=A0ABQ3ZZ42_9ACTN|nr:hypothetical protein [Actinoplanes humidus]GIE23875.1 hypothetical protein Ahu01nite_069770 [Actinoplanes humidus]
MQQEQQVITEEKASEVEELEKDNFEKLFGDKPLTIVDSEVKD